MNPSNIGILGYINKVSSDYSISLSDNEKHKKAYFFGNRV